MEICNYIIQHQAVVGIAFKAKNVQQMETYFFYVPTPEATFYKWIGDGWQELPADRLPLSKQQTLLEFWSMRRQAYQA